MKKLKNSLTLFFISINFILTAQSNNGHVMPLTPADGHSFVKYEKYNNRVLDYPFIREDDILWSKTLTQKIDLKQKKNHPFYFPTYPVKLGSGKYRKNLADILIEAVTKSKIITAYETEYFDDIKTVESINKMLFSIDTVEYEDIDTGEMIEEIDTIKVESKDIKEFLIIEDRFFDKKRSVLDVRIQGLCLIAMLMNDDTGMMEKQPLFWVWYPEVRQLLANSSVFNRKNSMERLTFDEMFQKRLFSSVITKESNLYDRSIYEYKADKMQQVLEAERIKNDIRNLESDLWEY